MVGEATVLVKVDDEETLDSVLSAGQVVKRKCSESLQVIPVLRLHDRVI